MKVSLIGMDALENVLSEIAPKQARNLMRATVHTIAGKVRAKARAGAPKATGRTKKAITAKRRKSPPDRPVSEVIVDPAAYYWRFHEYGTVKLPARPFILPAKEEVLANASQLLREEFGRRLEKAMAKAARG